jgi:two-component sensor histidine kinase
VVGAIANTGQNPQPVDGALSIDDAGRIEIAWQVEPTSQGDRMRLRWLESGGPPVMPPSRKGFGSRLIERGLAKELDGEVSLDFEPAGVICQIVMPVLTQDIK